MDVYATSAPAVVQNTLPTQNNNETYTVQQSTENFNQLLHNAIHDVNATIQHSQQLTEQLAMGQANNVEEVMIAAEKASVALELTVQVRNKAVEAYQEIMRMQM